MAENDSDYLPPSLREPRRFWAVSIVPGDCIVECLTCGVRSYGITAAHVLAQFDKHEQREHNDHQGGHENECGAYYGTGLPHPNGGAICRRPEGHPPVSNDGIGHNPQPTKGDRRG